MDAFLVEAVGGAAAVDLGGFAELGEIELFGPRVEGAERGGCSGFGSVGGMQLLCVVLLPEVAFVRLFQLLNGRGEGNVVLSPLRVRALQSAFTVVGEPPTAFFIAFAVAGCVVSSLCFHNASLLTFFMPSLPCLL